MKTETITMNIRGMICRSCVSEVEELLLHTRGVVAARASYLKGQVVVDYDPELVRSDTLKQRLSDCGYESGARGWNSIAVDAFCLMLTALLVWLLTGIRARPPVSVESGASLWAIFLTGLFTSPHCIGMCGGVLLGASAGAASPWKASLTCHFGRLLSYTAVGAVFGALGTAITYSGSIKSMVFTMVGLMVSLIGLNMWGLLPGLRVLFPDQSTFCRLPGSVRRRFSGRPLIIGLLTGLMPCGSLYAMWLHAISGGSASYGAVSMLAFALGTVPLLLVLGALGSLFPKKWRRFFLKASAVLITAMGAKMLLMGLRML